jgi:hypothetical protein
MAGKKIAQRESQSKGKEAVLAELEARCQELGIKVVYDDLRGEGGLCRVRERFWLIVNRRVSVATKIRLLNEALKKVGGQTTVPSVDASTVAQVRTGQRTD